MKTIAITIDEPTLHRLHRLEERLDRNRSEIIREAVQQYLSDLEREIEEEKERGVFHRLRRRLKRQTEILVRKQAEL